MTKASRPSVATRQNILEAASRLFAERGYQGATVAHICRLARANIAAVNYHFGSKEKLYGAAWRHAHEAVLRQCPPEGGIPADAPAAERLRGRIRAMIQKALLKEPVEMQIMRNEMANPTGLLHRVIEDAIHPLREATQAIIRELLGKGADDQEVALCEMSIVSPCMHLMHHHRAAKHQGLTPLFTKDMAAEMTEHFTSFALAGIRAVRSRLPRRAVGNPVGGIARSGKGR